MIQSKWKRLCEGFLGRGFLDEYKTEYFNDECMKNINIVASLFLLLFQVMILASVEFSSKNQNLRIISCTIISIILNIICFMQHKTNFTKFREIYFASLVVLWVGSYYSAIDKISEQILQKSIIIMEIQLYFCYFVVNCKNSVRTIILVVGYARILIGFSLSDYILNKENAIGLIFFGLSFLFFMIFFWILKQNNKMCNIRKHKEQLRYIELEKILNNDIQQGIMIITPKTSESILSVNDLKVKYVNNCFLNQFNVKRQEALHILPMIYASTIKHIDEGDKNRYTQKDSIQIKQQTMDLDGQKEQNYQNGQDINNNNSNNNNNLNQNSNQQNSIIVNSITKNAPSQIKPAIKLNKVPGREYNQLNDQIYNDVVYSLAESTKIVQEEGADIVHNLPPLIKVNKKQHLNENNNPNNQTNNIPSFNASTTHQEHSQNVLLSANRNIPQDLNTMKQRMQENKINLQMQKDSSFKGSYQKALNDSPFNKKDQQNNKNMNSLQNIEQCSEIIINTNKKQSKQNPNGMIIREGSNKNIHGQTSRTRVESITKNKGNSSQNTPIAGNEGLMTLLDRINDYHNQYLQRKEKNMSFSQRNSSDDQKYRQSLIIWEYRREERYQSLENKNRQIDNSIGIGIKNGTENRSKFQPQNYSYNTVKYQKQEDAIFSNQENPQFDNIQQNNHTTSPAESNFKGNEKSFNNQIQLNMKKPYSMLTHQKSIHNNNVATDQENDLHDFHHQQIEQEKVHLKSNPLSSPIYDKEIIFSENQQNQIQGNLMSMERFEKLDKFDKLDEKQNNAITTPTPSSVFQKRNPLKKQSQVTSNFENGETNNLRTLSMSHRPTNATTIANNQLENATKPQISQNNLSQTKGKRRTSNFSHNLVAKKIDENILEITREQRGRSGDNGVDQGEQREKHTRVDDDDDEEGDDRQFLEIKLFECEMDKEESIMVVVNNVNQRIKYERLKENQTKNDQMLANVTHDLKTPLNCMTLMVEGMKLDKQYNEVTTNMILENANLLMCLIQDILDYSQIKKGKLRLVQSYFYVSEIIQEVINLFQMQADQKNIKLISNICRSSNCSVNTSSNYNYNNNNMNTQPNTTQNVFNNSNVNATMVSQQQYLANRNHNNSLYTNNEMQSLANNDQIKNIQMHQDKNRIKQILINLISNALKFTQEGHIEIRCEIKDMEEHSSIKVVEFSVKDTGIGMNPHIKSQLFKMFNTFDQKGLNKNGIGLGLTICKRLVTFLGPSDHIDVESEVSKGSTFSFKVYKDLRDIENTHHSFSEESEESPDINSKSMFHDIAKSIKQNSIFKDEDQVEESQVIVNALPTSLARPNIRQLYDKDFPFKHESYEETPKSGAPQQAQFSMLIVDDQPFNIMAFKIVLKNFKQISITESYNGKDAFEKYQKQKYDFILMDYNMPIMNGYESLKLIRMYERQNNLAPCKIIIVSGFDERQKEFQKAMQGGADDFLTKPVNFKVITEKLNSYMYDQN